MTDQKYKLVPSPITNKMIERAGRAYDRAGNKPTVGTFLDAIEKAIEAAIAAAPELDCGACPGDGSMCKEICRLADDSPAAPEPVCRWSQYDESACAWSSECDAVWTFFDGGPEENGMHYCVGCGAKVVEVVGND